MLFNRTAIIIPSPFLNHDGISKLKIATKKKQQKQGGGDNHGVGSLVCAG
jgi:hypothetical protein